ncbi:MAG: hypothetical protein JJT95_08385 [Pararhodobacter sp.]|nr:hypothetical protein [Pararhodobacter sp.]
MNPDDAQPLDDALLMWRMVEALQIDLAPPLINGSLSFKRLQQMLRQCAKCPQPGSCTRFLDRNKTPAADPPRYCPNRRTLLALRASSQ